MQIPQRRTRLGPAAPACPVSSDTAGLRAGMTIIELMIAIVILATALVAMGSFMASFAHSTRVSSLQQRAIDLASDRIDSVQHAPTYASIDTMAGTQNVTADSSVYAVRTMVQLVGGGPTDTLNYKVVTVAVTIPTVTTPLRKTTIISSF